MSLPRLSFLIAAVSFVHGNTPEIIEILNTESTRWQGWVKNSGKYDGWRSQNIPPTGQLVYGLCGAQKKNDNWLRSPYILREQALSIKLEITFTMRSCKSQSDQKIHCEDAFYLMIYEADNAQDAPSSWNDRIYTRVAVVSADIRWTHIQEENNLNIKTYTIEPRRAGFFIALRDIGSCTMVKQIRLFYLACPSITHNFVEFPRILVSPVSRILESKGQCIPEAELIDLQKQPRLFCRPNGHWHISDYNFCHCKSGFMPSDDKNFCIKCPENSFKTNSGLEKCKYCPKNSFSNAGATKCICNEGFFLILSVNDQIECAVLKTIPQNIKANFTPRGSLQLSWDKPQILHKFYNTEKSLELYFKIICVSCADSENLYFTPNSLISQTSVIIDTLKSGTKYKFSITALNSNNFTANVSNSHSAFISVTTEPPNVLYKIYNLKIHKISLKSCLMISWLPPKINITFTYQVVVYGIETDALKSHSVVKTQILKIVEVTRCEVPYSVPQFAYQIKVRARSNSEWGSFIYENQINFSDIDEIKMEKEVNDTQIEIWTPNKLMVISVFSMGLLLIAIGSPMCCYCRYITSKIRRKKKINKLLTTTMNNRNFNQINMGSTATRIYIDPSNYEDPSSFVGEFTHEINPVKINIEFVIGEGEFGEVCKGELLSNDGRHKIPVAIKTLKSGCSEKETRSFLMEAAIMGQFTHPNIIRLEGIVTKTQPIMILTQFIEFGSLDAFLRKNQNQFSTLQLLGMLKDIASGMRYLSEMHYVHRDLAARNILVDRDLSCKVSDFGLSREIGADTTEGAYITKGGLIPIRWTAPEAINYCKFTTSSDVWSFGVVMWEVMSYGDRPYWNWSNKDVLQSIEAAYRLPSPKGCPLAIHSLMLDCWTYERAKRPKFAQILYSIETLLRCPESLSILPISFSLGRMPPINNSRCHQQNDYVSRTKLLNNKPFVYCEPVFSPESSIFQWLDCLGLPHYKTNFAIHNLSYLCQISKFTKNELRALNISDSAHQQKIMNNIKAMQNYFETLQTSTALL